jgi:CBS domain-containing protein
MTSEPLSVADIMSRDVNTLGRNDKLSIADDIMKQGRIRHMPVLDADGVVCGVLSQRDLFRGVLLRSLGYGSRLEDKLLNSHPVKEAMAEGLHTATPDMPAKEAARVMMENKIGCLPVLEGDKLVGIVTESDFVNLFAAGPDQGV